jgi:catechol 2,3-dioxygenase-like lactoylglutathione lyase family enzyme
MTTADLARRFLHVNVNTTDADAAQTFYADCLGLRLRMRTDPDAVSDGEIVGLTGKVRCETRFFYDSRGPRSSCAIEVIDWFDPVTAPVGQPDATSTGLAALAFVVADRAGTVDAIADRGFDILSVHAVGLVTGGPATVVAGADGVIVEIGDLSEAPEGAVHFAGARVTCTDLDASLAYYSQIGFVPVREIATAAVARRDLGTADHGEDTVRYCSVGLPEDADTTRLCLTQRHGPTTARPAKQPNQQGLYRCALRVENTHTAIASTPEGIAVRGPIWCPLPGTPIDGLNIAFLTDPDGVVLEYVERPLSHFSTQ